MPKTLIIFATRHGCTREAARLLAGAIGGDTHLVDLGHRHLPRLDEWDALVLGGSIHAGHIQGRLRRFLQQNRSRLLGKKVGLFLCCMKEGETAHRQFCRAFPEWLRGHAAVSGLFGGRFDFPAMNWLERCIVRRVAKVEESISHLRPEAIAHFAERWEAA